MRLVNFQIFEFRKYLFRFCYFPAQYIGSFGKHFKLFYGPRNVKAQIKIGCSRTVVVEFLLYRTFVVADNISCKLYRARGGFA